MVSCRLSSQFLQKGWWLCLRLALSKRLEPHLGSQNMPCRRTADVVGYHSLRVRCEYLCRARALCDRLWWSRIHGRRHLVAPRRCGTYARSRGLHWRHTKPESGPQQSRVRAYEYEWVICNTLDSCRSSLSSWRSVVSAPRRHNRTFTCVRPKRIGPTGRSSRVNVSVK